MGRAAVAGGLGVVLKSDLVAEQELDSGRLISKRPANSPSAKWQLQFGGQRRQSVSARACQNQIQAHRFDVLRGHASGVAGSTINHQSFHWACCQFL